MIDQQKRVGEWADIVFGTPGNVPMKIHANRINSELQEVYEELESYKIEHALANLTVDRVKEDPNLRRKLGLELADIVITVFRFASIIGEDVKSLVDDKQTINEGREWGSNGDGTGKHIKK